MSDADPHGGAEGSSASPAGSLDSPTAYGAIFGCGHATAPWPGVAFPRRRAIPIPVGGAAAVIMSPTPPRYMPGAPAAPTEAPATQTAGGISVKGKLRLLSASSTMIGEGLSKIYGKALLIGLAAADFCIWAGMPVIPGFFEERVIDWTDWSQLPGFFKGLSCVLDGASEVLQGSSEAFGAMRGSSRVFNAIRGFIPSASYSLQKSGKSHAAYAGGSCPQQGINTILSYHIIRRSYVDSVLIVEDSTGSRRSPKKVLPKVKTIKTLRELKDTVEKFKKGDPVHLIDVSEEDVSLELALDFWELLLAKGATALLRRDSNLCRMSKVAYSLLQEKMSLESQLETLNSKLDEIKQSITLISDMLGNTKPKSAKLTGPGRTIDFTGVSGNLPSASMIILAASDEKKAANQESEFNPTSSNTNISDAF